MTAVKAPVEAYYASGHCAVGSHDRCRGLYAGVTCQCACGHRPPEPEPKVLEQRTPMPAARLTRAAIALDVDHRPMPQAAIGALAALLRSEGAWAADRGDHYPDDRAPLLHLADLILGDTAP